MHGMRRWFRLRSVERDVDDEIALYFEEAVRDLEAGGMTPSAAREEASRRFGDELQYRRALMEIDRSAAARRRWTTRADSVRDVSRHAVRGVLRSPALSLGIVLAFALGIGANATMYATVERLLLRAPAHIEDPDGVRRLLIHRPAPDGIRHFETFAYPDYQDFTRTSGFSHVAAQSSRQVTLGSGTAAEQARAMLVTANYWDLIGVEPALGRFFLPAEDAIGVPPVAVLSWSRWQSEYGGRADVAGRTLDFGYGPYTIIGVTPKGFTGVDLQPVDMFVPFMTAGAHVQGPEEWMDSRTWYWHQAIARVAPGVTVEAAAAEATAHHRAGRAESTDYGPATVVAAPLLVARGPNAPSEVAVARWLLGVAGVVLLIACLNVANLLLARMLRQRRETSIRLALGISRTRLVAQILAEGLLLGLAGGAAALVLAVWGGTIVQNTLLPGVDWSGGPSPALLLVVLALSLLGGALSAAAPAIQASRRDVTAGLRTASGGISRSTGRMRATLSIAQAALSVVLLIGAGLFVRSLNGVHGADFGLDLWRTTYVAPVFEEGTVPLEERWGFYDVAIERVRRLPGVESATVVSGVPFRTMRVDDLRAQGVDSIPSSPSGPATSNLVDAEYFGTLGISLVRGRLFDERDSPAAARVAIISESFARALWPGDDAIGKCLFVAPDAPCSEVVGVVEDARRGRIVDEAETFQYYTPLHQRQIERRPPEAILVRTAAEDVGGPVFGDVQRELIATDPRVRWVRSMPFQEMVAAELRQWRLGATLFTLFGVLALVVAAIGLYSVLAFDVAQRVREIGLRTALGATRTSIVTLVIGRAALIAAFGIAIGSMLALALGPRLQGMLYDVGPRDPVTFAVVISTLAVVSVCAAVPPAWRASRVDPNVALRSD